MRVAPLLSLSILLQLSLALPARSEPTPEEMEEARRFAIAGGEAYRAGDMRGAIRNFERALSLVPHPTIQVNVGKAYEKLGQPKRAMSYCLRALRAEGLPPPTRKAAQECVNRLKPRLSAPKVKITSTPEGATIRVDGREVGATPWEGELKKGERQVMLSLAGHHPTRRQLELEAGKSYEEAFTFIPVAVGGQLSVVSYPEEARVLLDEELLGITPLRNVFLEAKRYQLRVEREAHLPHATQIQILDGEHLQLTVQLEPTDPPLDPTPGWILTYSGGAALLGAAYFGYSAFKAHDDADRLARTSSRASDEARYNDLVDDMHRDQIITDVLFLAGGAALSSGLTWLFFSQP